MISPCFPEVTEELLTQMVQKIVDGFHPDQVILFGSHAWGAPRPDSDVDLLIILDSRQRPAERSAQVSLACRPRGLAVDFLVKTPAEVVLQLEMGDPFLHRVLKQGRVLYARPVAAAVDRQG